MNYIIKYKLGKWTQIVQFDQTIPSFLKEKLTIWFNIKEKIKQFEIPTISLSLFPPKDKNTWQTHFYKTYYHYILYYKFINNKIHFYIQILYDDDIDTFYLYRIIINSILCSTILENHNMLYIHGILLNTGDVIFGYCGSGKTTLAHRIQNTENSNIQIICEDGVILDIDNKLVYPLPFTWSDNLFEHYNVDFSKPIKLNNLFLLQKDEEKELIEDVNKDIFKEKLLESNSISLNHPFKKGINPEFEAWISFNFEIQQKMRNRCEEMVDMIIPSRTLCLYTNTNDKMKEFKVL